MLWLRVASGVSKHFPNHMPEWGLGVILFNWGFVLLRPNETMAKYPAMATMLRVAPEDFWGWSMISVAILRIFSLVINGSFHNTPYIKYAPYGRMLGSFLSCFFWMQIAFSVLRDTEPNTGMAVYPVILVMDMYLVFSSARETHLKRGAIPNGRSGSGL